MKTAVKITGGRKIPSRNIGAIVKSNGTDSVEERQVVVPPLLRRTVRIPIVGITGLIVHNFSHKAQLEMLGNMTGKASQGREAKDPWQDFLGSVYPVPGKTNAWGVPAPAFKGCAVSAANDVELMMTVMKRAFHVNTFTVEVKGPPLDRNNSDHWSEWDTKHEKELAPYHAVGMGMRMDIVRLPNGKPDIRFRGWWPIWETELEVKYNPRVLSLEELLNLFRAGGSDNGVCEWRPSAPKCKTGEWGRFDVKEIAFSE